MVYITGSFHRNRPEGTTHTSRSQGGSPQFSSGAFHARPTHTTVPFNRLRGGRRIRHRIHGNKITEGGERGDADAEAVGTGEQDGHVFTMGGYGDEAEVVGVEGGGGGSRGTILGTVVSHENRTITCFSLTMLHYSLCSWSPWVPLHGIGTPRIPAKRF